MTHTYNPRTWEAEVGGLQVRGQTELHSEPLSQKKKSMCASLYSVGTLPGCLTPSQQHSPPDHLPGLCDVLGAHAFVSTA